MRARVAAAASSIELQYLSIWQKEKAHLDLDFGYSILPKAPTGSAYSLYIYACNSETLKARLTSGPIQ